jgi:hypothetical protein
LETRPRPPHLLPELLLLLLQPLLYFLNGSLLPLHLPLVEAGQELATRRKKRGSKVERRYRKEGLALERENPPMLHYVPGTIHLLTY